MKSAYPGASRMLILSPSHSIGARAVEIEMPSRISSSSKSVDGVALGDLAHPCGGAGAEEEGLGQRGLARPPVADQDDVADVLGRVALQPGSPRWLRQW